MCVTIPTQIRLNNLMLLTILFTGFFFYDIFMVFVTPLLTPKGESIMVEGATGAGTGERLPLLFMLPKFTFDYYTNTCGRQYSMLGFGDVIIPGMGTCLCVRFDTVVRNRRLLRAGNPGASMTESSINEVQRTLLYYTKKFISCALFSGNCPKK